jgi:hypothetical protein
MTEKENNPKEEKSKDKKVIKKEKISSLKQKAKKSSKTDSISQAKSLATREKLERDYEEDTIYVTFSSSPETKRTILARRPSQFEFLQILSLSVQAAKYEGKMDAESLEKMKDIYSGMNKIASNLSVDKSLDEDFWQHSVSFETLQNFITKLIQSFQQGSGLSEEDIESFR